MPDPTPGNESRLAGEPLQPLLGAGAEFEGLLLLHGPARIEGRVRGAILGSQLWIGPAGSVDARVEVDHLVVSGEVAGSVHVRGRIELRRTARVRADLGAESLVLEEGSFLEGRCSTGPAEPSPSGENGGPPGPPKSAPLP
jgi:cytoskeletal protein CcmA (bactofilin family)